MNTESIGEAAPSITIPTEEQVVAFFKSKLGAFQAKLPGYACINLDVSKHGSGEQLVAWKVYHNDTGHSPDNTSCDEAVKWHFTSEAYVRRIATLREEAAERLKLADQLEHATL